MTMHDSPEGQEEKMRIEFEEWFYASEECQSDDLMDNEFHVWQACASQYSATIARLEAECDIANRACIKLNRQLAAAELSNRQLREALELIAAERQSRFNASDRVEIARSALAQPISTEALDAYVAKETAELNACMDDQNKCINEQARTIAVMQAKIDALMARLNSIHDTVWNRESNELNHSGCMEVMRQCVVQPLPPSPDKKD